VGISASQRTIAANHLEETFRVMDEGDAALNVYQARVRSHQTDLNAAMYHGAYLDLFDDARIETFRRMGYTYARMLAGNWGVFIRTVQCDFHAPAFMDDLISVTVSIPRLTTATMIARYECRRGAELLVVGENTYVFVDGQRKPLRVPHDLRALIEQYRDLLNPAT
jgi:acyl-CoA thioester hydrolase